MSENGNGNQPNYEGESVKIGGRAFIIPSLSVAQTKRLWPELIKINEGITVENVPDRNDRMLAILHAAISRNEPDLKIDELAELVSIDKLPDLVVKVAQQSGFVKPKGEVSPAAETVQ